MRAPMILLATALLAAVPAWAFQPAAPSPDVLEPASSGGLETIDLALFKLTSHRRLLVVGAHPDDEDNALLTWVGRGLGGEAAYLSLSRGEGGQNLIGTELGVGLGVVRTGELEAARRIEGTRQYFARAYDFGYTRSLDETLERWPREVLLEDTMRAIRRTKPQVIVAVFPGDARAGHGQHQASGLVAREAFAAAAEGRDFPALEQEGLEPWAPSSFYQRAWSREQATAAFDLGVTEPLGGRTLAQIASASRSRHRSQDMGREQRIGRLLSGVAWEAGAGEGEGELFGGIDTRLESIAELLADPELRDSVAAALRRVSETAAAARGVLTPTSPGRAVEPLVEIVTELDRVLAMLTDDSSEETLVRELVAEKRSIAAQGLLAAAGVMVDATVDRELAVAGEELTVTAELWVGGDAVVETDGVFLIRPFSRAVPALEEAGVSERSGVSSWRLGFRLPATDRPTVPYYLRAPRQGDLYDWSSVDAAERGEPRHLPPAAVLFELRVEGAPVSLVREAVHRYGDQASGEVRRPLRVVPALEVEIDGGLVLWNRGEVAPRALRVILRSNVERPLAGTLRLRLPEEWSVEGADPVAAPRFSLDASRREQAIELPLTVPAGAARGLHRLAVEAIADGAGDGAGVAATAIPTIEYPHVTPTPLPREATVDLSVFDLELPPLARVGYVVGASDRLPSVLTDLGLPLEVLGADDLARGDLGAYDAIVVGSRAYETDAALTAANDRLLDYARAGGTLIVQYQQYQFVRGEYAPFSLSIGRPHGRVTDETAEIALLEPEHPVFHHPNEIGAEDWAGWVQERGLYFAESWDESYRPLLTLADEGREAERGALLMAPYGDGVYVYTGLSFFRQLPAGVPGAIRLFANLLALGSER